jgi:hypothetical protein
LALQVARREGQAVREEAEARQVRGAREEVGELAQAAEPEARVALARVAESTFWRPAGEQSLGWSTTNAIRALPPSSPKRAFPRGTSDDWHRYGRFLKGPKRLGGN